MGAAVHAADQRPSSRNVVRRDRSTIVLERDEVERGDPAVGGEAPIDEHCGTCFNDCAAYGDASCVEGG